MVQRNEEEIFEDVFHYFIYVVFGKEWFMKPYKTVYYS